MREKKYAVILVLGLLTSSMAVAMERGQDGRRPEESLTDILARQAGIDLREVDAQRNAMQTFLNDKKVTVQVKVPYEFPAICCLGIGAMSGNVLLFWAGASLAASTWLAYRGEQVTGRQQHEARQNAFILRRGDFVVNVTMTWPENSMSPSHTSLRQRRPFWHED